MKNRNINNFKYQQMKNFILTAILFFLSSSFWGVEKSHIKTGYTYESTVVINIKNHTADEFKTAQDLLLKSSGVIIDYQCLVSGIIVFKVNHNFMQQSDVKHFIYKALSSKVPINRIGILFIDIHSKTSKC